MELHILLAGVEFGPYTDNQVRELLGEGFLSETDPAKRLDETDWLPLSDVLAQSRAGTTAPEEPAAEIPAGEEEATPASAESTPEEEPSAATPPETEPATQEAPEEIVTPEPPPLPAPKEEAEAPAPETEPAAEASSIFSEEKTEEPPAPVHVEEPAPIGMPAAEQEETPAAARPVGATTGPRQLTAAEKTAFLLPVTAPLPPVTPAPPRVTTARTPIVADPAPAAPTPIVSTIPLLRVSLPAKAKKAMRTGALLAQESLRAARNQKGILSPTGALSLEAVAPPQPVASSSPPPTLPAPEPVAAPEPAPVETSAPRRKPQLILRSREETQALPAAPAAASTSAPAQRKAIRLTGRITLPGLEPKPELPQGKPPSLSGPLVVGRPARTGATPPRASTRPLTAKEKSSFLIGQIARPADIAREEIAAETAERVAAPVLEEKKIEEISAPSREDEPEPVEERVQAAGEETVAEEPAATEPVPGSVTALLQAAGTETVAEPSADSGALPTLEEPPADADLSASGRLISSGELAERRSLKITGPLRHPVPRAPIRLSSPSKPGDSSRLPYSTGERPPVSALPLPEAPPEPVPQPLPPAPKESLPHHPETGKIPVSAMPAEGIRIRSRRITNKVSAPEKEREPEPLSLRVTPPPSLPEAAPELSAPLAEPKTVSVTPPRAEPEPVVPPTVEPLPAVAAEPAVLAEDPPALTGPTLVTEIAAPAAAAGVDEIPGASTAAAPPVEAPDVARPDKVRLRRPVKLELSSRTKTQDSGRLTLEAFSKMASLDLPGTTAPTVETATPAAKATPVASGVPVSPPGPTSTPPVADYDQPRLEEAPPLVWKSTTPETGRHWEWLSYAVITFLAVAFCAIVYIFVHRSHAHAASAPAATITHATPASPATSVPPASAEPPATAAAPAPALPKTSAPAKPPSASAAAKPPATNVAAPSASIQDLNRQVDADIDAGFQKYRHGDFGGALAAENQALDLNPKSAPALFDRGLVKEAQNDLDGAVADYSAALQIDPALATAYYHRGMVRHAKAELDGALSDYSQAVQLDPTNAPAFFVRGMIRMQKDDLDGAISDSTRALAIDPHQIPAYYDRGLARLAKGQTDSALTDMKTYCQLAPQDVFTDYARLYIWLIESQPGHLAEANQELAKTMNTDWNGAADSMVTHIGEFLLGQISENALIKSSASAIPVKDQGQRCEVWYFIGMRKLQAGDKQAAIDDLRKCVDTQKTDYCEYILAQEELKKLVPAGANAGPPPAPRAQAVTLPDPGTMAPK